MTITIFGRTFDVDERTAIPITFAPPTKEDRARMLVWQAAEETINDMAKRLREGHIGIVTALEARTHRG